MKVLQINSVCGIRSTGRICSDIAGMLTQEGIDCRIAFGREQCPERYHAYALRIGTEASVRLHGIKARLLDAAGFGSKRPTEEFIKQVEAYDPDVIHLHNIHGYYLHIEVLFDYLKRSGKPVVWTLHDCWPFTGHCSYMTDCEKWKTGCFSCPKYHSYPASYVDRSRWNYEKKKRLFCGEQNLTIVTPSKWLADLTQQSFLAEYPIKVIHNGIDVNVFKPTASDFRERMGLTDKIIVLGVAAVWGKRKGLNDFYTLANRLGDRYQVVLVGLTEQQKEMLPTNILGITRTNSTKELAEIYTAADVFVNPTYNDNYPTVNLEAQACGTPALTYCTGGSVESVLAENVIPQGDVDALVKAIQAGGWRLKKDLQPDKREMAKQYLQIYNSVVAQGKY